MKTATTLFCRLFWEKDCNEGKGQDENEDTELANNTNKTRSMEVFFEDFRHTLNISQTPLTPSWRHETFVDDKSQVTQFQTLVKQEMKLLEAIGKRPSKLKQLFKALLAIPLTSVEAE